MGAGPAKRSTRVRAVTAIVALVGAALVTASMSAAAVVPAEAQAVRPLTVRITNSTDKPDRSLFVTIDPGGTGPVTLNGAGKLAMGFGHGVRLTSFTGPGTDPTAHTYTFSITGAVSSMRLYYSIGSALDKAPNAETSQVRYDYAEFTTDGNGRFDGDLTAIDQVGIPARMQLRDRVGAVMTSNGSPADRRISCIQDVKDALTSAAPDSWDIDSVVIRNRSGGFLRILGPAPGPEASARYPSMKRYAQSLAGRTLTVEGRFVGNGVTQPTDYRYSGRVDGAGNIFLRGTLTGGGYTPKSMFVAGGDLYGADTKGFSGYGIYLQNGPFTLDGRVTWDAGRRRWVQHGGGDTQAVHNDVYGWIYGDLVAAFAYGYWGGRYGNNSHAFERRPAFAAARVRATPFAAWNIYEQAIWKTSDSYGMALGERFGAAGKRSPLVTVGPNPPVGTMRLNLLANDGCPVNPDPQPGAKTRQVPASKLDLPRKLKNKGKTVLLRKTFRTNAGQRIRPSVSCTAPSSRKKRPCRFRSPRSGRTTIGLSGRWATKVRLKLAAPETAKYTVFKKTKVYRTKRVR